MPPVQSRKLTPHQFEFVRLFLLARRYSAPHIEAARLCMVEAHTMQAVADDLGFSSRQAVGETVKRVWALWLEMQSQYVPPPEPAPKPHKSAARAPAVKAAPGKAGSGAKSRTVAKAKASARSGSASSARKKTASAVASAKAKK